ncbi:MAG: histidine phosphatase family protein [Candidatus Odinarchaeota archaeon]
MKIIFIRHGQTDSSLHQRLSGSRTNEHLNKTGIDQIQHLKSFLKIYNPTKFYSSSLLRAKQSAEIMLETKSNKIIELDELREIDFGDWEGLTFEELNKNHSKDFINWMDFPDQFTPPNGESISMLCSRIKKVMKHLLDSIDSTCFVFTHGGPIRAVLINSLQIPLSKYWSLKIPHGSATCVEYSNNRFYLHYLGRVNV